MFTGPLNIFSILYLSFVVAFIFGLNDHNEPRKVARATLRRWIKLIGALVIIAVLVHILSHI
jgi:succinate dehydrogenase hydrophobic anchor subunit